MRKFALLAASSAGALFTILVQADAMTFSNKTSVLDIVASADTVNKSGGAACAIAELGTTNRRRIIRIGAGTSHGLTIRIITSAQDNRTSVLLIKRNASLAAAGPNLRSVRDLIEAARRAVGGVRHDPPHM